jgi:hypothetical protein
MRYILHTAITQKCNTTRIGTAGVPGSLTPVRRYTDFFSAIRSIPTPWRRLIAIPHVMH